MHTKTSSIIEFVAVLAVAAIVLEGLALSLSGLI